MKENIDIEKLFQEKFENFEGNVDPSVWANVSQSINAGAAGTGAFQETVIGSVLVTGAGWTSVKARARGPAGKGD